MTRLILCLLLMLCLTAHAGDAELELAAHDGQRYKPLLTEGKKAVLLVFIARYDFNSSISLNELNAIAWLYRENVRTYFVCAGRQENLPSARVLAKEHHIQVPVLVDPKLKLTWRVRAKVTPEAVVIAPDGTTLYQGRMDDSLQSTDGKHFYKGLATTTDLQDALRAIVAGKPCQDPFTKPRDNRSPGPRCRSLRPWC